MMYQVAEERETVHVSVLTSTSTANPENAPNSFFGVYQRCATEAGVTHEFLKEAARRVYAGVELPPGDEERLRKFQALWTTAFDKMVAAMGDQAFWPLDFYQIRQNYFDREKADWAVPLPWWAK